MSDRPIAGAQIANLAESAGKAAPPVSLLRRAYGFS